MRFNTFYIGLCIIACVVIDLTGCHKSARLQAEAILDRTEVPVLDGWDITTLISDSGITSYRITTPHWLLYDKGNPPHWEFPEGIYLEKFDEQLEVNAWLKSDYAYYNEQAQTWHLTGNVHAMNMEGEQFETPELWWNQNTQRIYSDSAITITREATIIKGVGFNSNQTMSEYTILRPTGIFPIKDE